MIVELDDDDGGGQALRRHLSWLAGGLAGAVAGPAGGAPGEERVSALVAIGLLGLPARALDEGVERALAAGALRVQALRAVYYRLDEAAGALLLSHEWHADGQPPMKGVPLYGEVPVAAVPPPLFEALRRGAPLPLPRLEGLFGGGLAGALRGGADRSLLLVPVLSNGVLLGVAGFAAARDRAWAAGELDLLSVIAAGVARVIEQKRVEDALRDSEGRFRAMCESSPLGIFLADAGGGCAYLNPAARELVDLSPEEARGRGWMSALHPDDRAGIAAGWGRAVSGTARYEAPVHRFVRKDGGVRSVRVRAVPLGDPAAPTGFLGLLEDVTADLAADTERAELLARAEAARAEAERARQEVASLLARVSQDRDLLAQEIRDIEPAPDMIGQSPGLRAVLERVARVARSATTVLVLGETGSGKELVARAIHEASPRRDRVLVKVNCAAISAGLVESELFGHERGAFTGAVQRRKGRFETAHGGTLFLDEVGELPLEAQSKLLRVLQERELERVGGTETVRVDVRVVAATNRDLAEMVASGKFREDLYYRLAVFPVELPPLRARPGDVPLLARFFLGRFARRSGKRIEDLSPAALERLAAYHWPGNVRELENVIERAVILTEGPVIEAEALPALARRPATLGVVFGVAPARSLPVLEPAQVERVLGETGWVIEGERGAARRLGLHPNTLRSRLKRWGVTRPARSRAVSGS
jgi:PAS domain S-box-containing protein